MAGGAVAVGALGQRTELSRGAGTFGVWCSWELSAFVSGWVLSFLRFSHDDLDTDLVSATAYFQWKNWHQHLCSGYIFICFLANLHS